MRRLSPALALLAVGAYTLLKPSMGLEHAPRHQGRSHLLRAGGIGAGVGAVLAVLVVVYLGLRWLVNSSYGYILVGIREDEARTETFGYDVRLIQLSVFCIAAAIAGLSGVRHIYSNVTDGVSSTTIEFELGTDTDRATNDVRNAMTGLRASLPQDMQEPAVQRIDITGDGAASTDR